MLVITMITRIAGCDNAAKLISRPAYGQGDADLTANARSSSVRDILPALPLVLGRTLLPPRAGSVSGRGAGSSPAGAARARASPLPFRRLPRRRWRWFRIAPARGASVRVAAEF